VAIRTFARREVEDFFVSGERPRREGWAPLAKIVTRKLDMLHYAHRLDDLRVPPANNLEALKGNLRGFHSIRVNDQWRLVFRWTDQGPQDVDVVDYHR
jgi:proteic killer suppression protein